MENPHRNLRIAGAGPDMAGKTTTLKALALCTGGQYSYWSDANPLKKLRPLTEHMNPEMRFLYFLLVNLTNYKRLESMRRQSHVFLDGSIYTTMADQLGRGMNPAMIEVVPRLLLNQIDRVLFVNSSTTIREQRLKERKSRGEFTDKADELSLQIAGQIENHLRILTKEKLLEVGTDVLPIDKCVTQARNMLGI